MDRERLLLQDAWRRVQDGRAEVASGELHVAEETQKLERRHHVRALDLEAQLSSAEKRLEQVEGELRAARAKELELKGGAQRFPGGRRIGVEGAGAGGN